MKKIFGILAIFTIAGLVIATTVNAGRATSSSYKIITGDSAAKGYAQSSNYKLYSSTGQAGPIGVATSSNYKLQAGFVRNLINFSDLDGDGVRNDIDNCPNVANPDQLNSDAQAIDNGPGIAGDDGTLPAADNQGNACDADDDNDGLADVDENPLASCGSFNGQTTTHPNPQSGDLTNDDNHNGNPASSMGTDSADNGPSWDTDNDGILDGYECSQGSNPRNKTSTPPALSDDNQDTDGDGLRNGWERRGWGTDPGKIDTDSDGKGDCKEAADVNGDGVVDYVGDTISYAKAALLAPDKYGKTMDFDINKDGVVDYVGDTIQEAKFALTSNLCK